MASILSSEDNGSQINRLGRLLLKVKVSAVSYALMSLV